MKRVWVVVGDIGGTNAVIPVIERLISAGHEVTIVADKEGKGRLSLKHPCIVYCDSWLARQEIPDLVLIGTSATACEAQMVITCTFKDECPIVWLEDFWGTASVPAVKDITPDYMFVLDQDSSRREGCETVATGNPAFDRLAGWDVMTTRVKVRKNLGIPEDEKIVTFFGPGHEEKYPFRILEAMAILIPAAHAAGATFVPLFHPKDTVMSAGFAQMMTGWRFTKIRLDVRRQENDMNRLVAASDLVVSINGTALLVACLLRIPALSVIGPQSAASLKSRGLDGPCYLPCVANHSVSLAMHMGLSIVACLAESTPGIHGVGRQSQIDNYPNDGQATDRVVTAIMDILG